LERVLKILSDKGLHVNAEKSTSCATEIEYLGYWISRSSIQPIPKKVEAIIVHTDQENLTYTKITSVRVMRWCLLIEEFGPEFRHIKGKHNLIADALSRLELDDSKIESNFEKPTAQCMAAIISRTEIINDEPSPTDGFEMAEAFGMKSKKKTKVIISYANSLHCKNAK
jgi:hypothetical protein